MTLYIRVLSYNPHILTTIEIESADTVKSVCQKVLDCYRKIKVEHGGDKVPPANATFLCSDWLAQMQFSKTFGFYETRYFKDKASFSLFVKDLIRESTSDEDLEKLRLLREYSVDDIRLMIALLKSKEEAEKKINALLEDIQPRAFFV